MSANQKPRSSRAGMPTRFAYRRLWGTALLALSLGCGTWILLIILGPGPPPANLPEQPDRKPLSEILWQTIIEADERARNHPDSAEDVGRLGMVYHANQFYEKAENAYRLASWLDRGEYRWIYCQALLHEENGREKAQYDLLVKTVQLRPDYVPALVKLGDICFKQDNMDEAARNYERAATAAGKSGAPQALFGLARISAKRKDWQKVVSHLTPVAREYPLMRPVHQLLADAYTALGQAEMASEEQWALLRTDLTPVPAIKDPLSEGLIPLCCSSTRLLKEAGLLSRFGAPARALDVARRAIEVEPDDADARHFVSRILLETQGADPQAVDEALTQLKEGLRLRPDDQLPLFYAAAFFFKHNKTDAAVERLRMMLARNDRSAQAQYYLGLVADRQGRNAEAVAHYRKALQRDADYAEPYHRLGLFLASEGQLDQAIAHLRKAVSLNPMFIGARCHLGAALEFQGKVDQAIEQYREAIRLKPNDTEPRISLANALARTGKLDEAVLHLRETVRITPADAAAHYGLGSALASQGKTEEAVQELRQALRLSPNYPEAQKKLQELQR